MGKYTDEILRNADKIRHLHARIHETVKCRDKNEYKWKEWVRACAAFDAENDSLAFPVGLKGAYERIVAGHPPAMEAAICFLECRPYFVRSGYMFTKLLRKAKRAPLSNEQKARLECIIAACAKHRKSRHG